jgi:hypothetical protein
MLRYSVVFTITNDLEADDFCDPNDKYIVNVQCAVTAEDPSKPNEEIEIGSMSFGIVQVGRAIKNRERLFDVFDAESGDYEYAYETLFDIDKRGEFKKDIQKRFGIKSGNVFILNASHMPPEHHEAELATISSFLDTFSNESGLIILMEKRTRGKSPPQIARWGKLGFEVISKDGLVEGYVMYGLSVKNRKRIFTETSAAPSVFDKD